MGQKRPIQKGVKGKAKGRAHSGAYVREKYVLDGINRVLQETLLSETDEEVARTCLAVAEELTGSAFGWISELNLSGRLDNIAISNPGWDACTMPRTDAPRLIKDMELRGIWSAVLRDKRSLIVNEPASHPDSVGTPKGHPPIRCFLGVPLHRRGQVFGMIALGNKDGGYVPADLKAVEHLTTVFVEALDRKRREEALKESEEKFRSISMSALDAILMMGPEGEISFWNPAAEGMFGYKHDEAMGKNLHKLLAPRHLNTAHNKAFPHFQKTGDGPALGKVLELIAVKKDSTEFPIELTVSPIKLTGRWNAVGIIRDISERKRLEKEKMSMEEQMRHQQKMESIGTLAAGVAHEINNPINIASNYAELILDEVEPGGQIANNVAGIIVANKRIATIVKNLLAFARQDKEQHSPARVFDIVGATISLIRKVLENDQITVQVDVPEELPKIRCRSQQIQQVLMNLLTNARDALNDRYSGYHEDKKVRVIAQRFEKDSAQWIRITVENHGDSIPTDLQDRLFDPFYTTKPKDKGTGLGLSVSHGIVKEHNGEISVESEEDGWTRFHLDLLVNNGWSINQDLVDV